MSNLFDPSNRPDPSTNPLLAIFQEQAQTTPTEAAPSDTPISPEPVAETPVQEPAPAPTSTPTPAQPQMDLTSLQEALTGAIQNGFANMPQAQPTSGEPASEPMTPEQIEETNARLRDEMLDNPLAFLQKYGDEIKAGLQAEFDARLQPFEQRAQMAEQSNAKRTAIEDFKANTPDFDDFVDGMAQHLAEHPELEDDPRALQIAYNAVKAQTLDPQNETFVAKAASDERVKQQVIQDYLKSIQDGQPPAMVSSVGASPVMTPAKEAPKDMKQASALFKASLANGGGF